VSGIGRLLFALLAPTLFSCSALGAERSPADIVSAFFGKENVSDKKDWFAGEIIITPAGPKTIGQALPPDVRVSQRPLLQSSDHAIYAVVLTRNGESLDWYAYLSRSNGDWRLEAVRSLMLPGFVGQLYTVLRDKKQRTPEEELQFRNLDLTGRSDEQLRAYFAAHQVELEEIKDHFLKRGGDDGIKQKTEALYLGGVQRNETGCIEIVIGGFMDNFVGYMFVPDGKSPPSIDRSNYIMIDRIAGRWYLYKTT
jgi:hypothetical protein